MNIGASTNLTTGKYNTFVGHDISQTGTTAANNAGTGYQAMRLLTTGSGNVGNGANAIGQTSSGSENIGIGFYSGYSNSTGSNNIFIGGWAGAYYVNPSNRLIIQSINQGSNGVATIMGDLSAKQVGIGLPLDTTLQAALTLPKGTTTQPPLRFITPFTALTTSPIIGSIETLDDSIYWSPPSGGRVKVYPQSTGGGGGSPAGNYGNVQINRNGSFDTPASDTLSYTTAAGLTIKNLLTTNAFLIGKSGTASRIYNNTATTGSTAGISIVSDNGAGAAGGTIGLFTGSQGMRIAVGGGSQTQFQVIYGGNTAFIEAQTNLDLFGGSGMATSLGANGTKGYLNVATTGRVGIGTATTSPSAALQLPAGTATASTAPFKLTTGTVNTTAEAGAIEYTTPQLFFTNGTAVRQEIQTVQQSRVSSQFDKTNETLANITGLTANVAASGTYRFEATLYTTSDVAGGIKVAIGGTATATAIIYEGLTTDAGLTTQSRTTTLGNAVGAVTAVTAGYVKITGTITVNGAGTLTVQSARNAANGTTSY